MIARGSANEYHDHDNQKDRRWIILLINDQILETKLHRLIKVLFGFW